jgi:proteasome accessory factor B
MLRIERLLRLVQLLQSDEAKTASELARLVGVSRRTIFRDLELLTQAGIRYEFDHATRRYSAERTTLLPPISLTPAEALGLMLVTRNMLGQEFALDEAVTASAALKIEGMLPPAMQDYCGPLLDFIEIRPEPGADAKSIAGALSNLQTALTERTKVRVHYDCPTEKREIDLILHPYRLVHIDRAWHLIAFAEGTNDVRTYKLARILQLEALADSYRIDPGFNLDDYFGNAWLKDRGERRHHVKIRFEPTVAAAVDEITWHKTQRTTFEEDGSLTFEVDVDGIEEIAWWILGYGDEAEVLAPPELRELLCRHARRMCAYYNRIA